MYLKDYAILDSCLPEYEKISEAPSVEPPFTDDEARTLWLLEEKNKLYKAVDGAGNIVLISNPLVWKIEIREGREWAVRPKPKIVMRAKDVKQNKPNKKDIF